MDVSDGPKNVERRKESNGKEREGGEKDTKDDLNESG